MTQLDQWRGRGKWRQPNKIRKVKNLGQFHTSSKMIRRRLGARPAKSNEQLYTPPLVRVKKPSLVFFMETKQLGRKVKSERIKLGFDGLFEVDCIRRSGGLALFWKLDAQVHI